MSGRLSGKVAVITGGASGIGRATCLRIASEGCHVAVIDIDEKGAQSVAEECAKAGVEVQALRADVSDENEVETAISKTLSRFKRLDFLVSNAGIEGAMRDFGETTAAEWDRVMAVNVRQPCARKSRGRSS
jgi:NAD(P)-dependent dehydrogenase (short-subunit alcohol dehydrogenase family)